MVWFRIDSRSDHNRRRFHAAPTNFVRASKLVYREIRERFGLSAQMAVRAIGKAVECFQRDKTKCPAFKPHGAVTYDERILGFKGVDRVSLWTMTGRMVLPLAYGEYQGQRFGRIKGQCDLV
jgi:putative transposase